MTLSIDVQHALDELVAVAAETTDRGQVAGYIQELSRQDPALFGISVALSSGEVLAAGDARRPFSVQSISKVFTLAMALGRLGESLWLRVGREPSGLAFNSILQLEQENGRPRNPFVNAGALVVTDAILSTSEPREVLGELLRFVREAAEDNDIYINSSVARSEAANGHRNSALAHMLRAQGNLQNTPERVLGTYFHQCALEMTCVQLARAGRFLVAAHKATPIGADNVRRINALMMTCGHYDGSGDFAYRVGLPAKSGVGGGILAIAPRRASIAVWSPGLDIHGNSKLGTMAAERLAGRMGWSVFS
jgi:glutaminase